MQPSLANLRWLHVRLRLAGFRMRGLRKANAPAKAAEVPKCFEIGAREDWGRFLKRLDERLMSPDTYGVAPGTKTIAGVVTYGLNQLDPALAITSNGENAARDKVSESPVGAAFASPPHGDHDFIECWHDAMCREMGAEELEKFALTLGEPHHGATLG